MISTLVSKKMLPRTAVGLRDAEKLFPLTDVELGDVFKGASIVSVTSLNRGNFLVGAD
jgi:hypothetical protein